MASSSNKRVHETDEENNDVTEIVDLATTYISILMLY